MKTKNLKVEKLAKIIWNYMRMNQKIKKADLILVMGSHDLQVADRGIELFLQGFAPLMLVSGGLGKITKDINSKSEAELFADRAIHEGVPKGKILIENKSKNTGQNIEFAKRLLKNMGIKIQSVILIQKPYMERRAFATFLKLWPEVDVVVTSPKFSFEEYKTDGLSRKKMIEVMVGDLQRIKEYPKMGFQIEQEIPNEIWDAYGKLVAQGYDNYLIKS